MFKYAANCTQQFQIIIKSTKRSYKINMRLQKQVEKLHLYNSRKYITRTLID